MTELRVLVLKFLPLYHKVVSTTVATAKVDGSQRTGRFSGENAQGLMSFGRRTVAISRWWQYTLE